VLDLAQLARIAARTHTPVVVDNTTATAALQRPLDLGATAVLTSLTKSTSGHADVLLGSVSTRDEGLIERVHEWRTRAGAIAGPFEAWLTLRGLRTLPLRIARQSENAAAIAAFLTEHPRVRRVHYPGLEPSTRDLARRQMPAGGGPLLSFELDGDAAAAVRVVSASHLVRPASSFGGLQSSWERRARWAGETAPESLIRFSAGIEAATDLIADVEAALEAR
jgi:cystathionine gamma-lyase